MISTRMERQRIRAGRVMERPSFTAPRTPVGHAPDPGKSDPGTGTARTKSKIRTAHSRAIETARRRATNRKLWRDVYRMPLAGANLWDDRRARYPVCLNSLVERPSPGYLAGAS